MWTFDEAEAYLNDTAPPGKSVYGLGRISHLLDLLKHPETGFPCLTIVGTNGKGSVLAFLDSLLRAHGIRVACHVKPHLESVTERIRIDGLDSTPQQFASCLWEVRQAVDGGWSRDDRPTYFELIFAAFLCAARDAGVDVALLEAGLGGRLDAVNAVDAPLVILTSVGYDHTELLGDSLESISAEKLAVVRPGATLVCQVNPPEVMETVRTAASTVGFRVVEADDEDYASGPSNGEFRYSSRVLGPIDNLTLGLAGPYQPMNANVALLGLDILSSEVAPALFADGISRESIMKGLREARLPGRWETIRVDDDGRRWILDGAHNVAGLRGVLTEFANETGRSGTVIFGMKKDKKVGEIMPELLRSAGRVIFVPVPGVEYHEPEALGNLAAEGLDKAGGFSQIQISRADSISEACEQAGAVTPSGGTVVVTGSLYLVGAARSILKEAASIPQGRPGV